MEQASDFKKTVVKDSETIQSAIKKCGGSEELLEDRSFDMIAAIVYNKITNLTGEDSYSTKESEGITLKGFFMFLVTAISVIYMLGVICEWTGIGSFKNLNLGGGFFKVKTSQKGTVTEGQFEFKAGNSIATSSFFGKKDLFELWEGRILDSVVKIATKPKDILDKLSIYQKLNFVLFGPPGTGKTLFVQVLATRIDFKLKEMYLKESDPDKYKEMSEKPKGEYQEYINKMPSRIRFCEVQPAMINSKFIGDAEKNVRDLFTAAKKTLDEKWKVTILFFDEGDVFFDKRVSGESDSGRAAGKVKSELLTKIGVRPTEEYKPLLIFTASNRMEEFDPAFKRRFANQEEFNFPSFEERKEFINFLLDGFDVTKDEIALIATYTERKSYSYISEKMKLFMTANDDGEFTMIEFRRYMAFLKRNHSNRNMV